MLLENQFLRGKEATRLASDSGTQFALLAKSHSFRRMLVSKLCLFRAPNDYSLFHLANLVY